MLAPTLVLLSAAAVGVQAQKQGPGIIGYGTIMYNPSCAFACRSAIAGFPLDCTDTNAGHDGHSHGGGGPTTPECRAQDTYYLQTLAYCMDTQCRPFDVKASKLEWYWEEKATGSLTAIPKWTYAQALESIETAPTIQVEEEGTLNFTAKVDEKRWYNEKVSMEFLEYQETRHSRYTIVIVAVAVSIPFVLTVFGYLPYTNKIIEKANAYITYPSTIGIYNIRPLPFLLGYAPTIGQSLYIVFFLLLNIFLTALDYPSVQPNTWFDSRYNEICAYVANRTGVIAFGLLPVTILFSSRNNFLLWITNWSHTTYLLLHRWVAWILVIQTVIHSIAELILYFPDHATEVKKPYWIWGVVGTIAMVVMIPSSLLWVRRRTYEIFLIAHVLMAVFVIVGCWYHIELLFAKRWGYQFWIYAACAVWFFDRLVRVFRTWKVGTRQSIVKEITPQIVRVDIPSVRWGLEPGQHAYVTFPTLSKFRPWENHPFSVVPTALLSSSGFSMVTQRSGAETPATSSDVEKSAATQEIQIQRSNSASSTSSPSKTHTNHTGLTTTSGVTLFIRRSTGITKFLTSTTALTTLIEGPYISQHAASLFTNDRLLVVAGGIGITGAFPYLWASLNSKLYWSVKRENEPLVREFAGAIGNSNSEQDIKVGDRFLMSEVLERELEVLGGKGTLGVVVCGPAGMCDELREAVVRASRSGGIVIDLHVEAFVW